MSETINQRILKYRKLANLTQAEVADKLGMKSNAYSQMERKGNISADRLVALASIMGIHPDILLFGETENDIVINKLDFTPKPKNSRKLKQSPTSFVDSLQSGFVATHKEENIIKIIRHLPKDVRAEVMEYIEQKYKEYK